MPSWSGAGACRFFVRPARSISAVPSYAGSMMMVVMMVMMMMIIIIIVIINIY
jgi:hypothetical protein